MTLNLHPTFSASSAPDSARFGSFLEPENLLRPSAHSRAGQASRRRKFASTHDRTRGAAPECVNTNRRISALFSILIFANCQEGAPSDTASHAPKRDHESRRPSASLRGN
jgi:hypothetical protein